MKFTINGQKKDVDYPPDTPLLWVIREGLGLKGTKFGCGMGLCGACTVHLNGSATRSCQTPLAAVEGMKVTTIEGLKSSKTGGLTVVQKAWVSENVPQCGYCQPGQIMSASALLARNKNPNDADVDAAMAGNICRCGTYPRIRKAIKVAARSLAKGES